MGFNWAGAAAGAADAARQQREEARHDADLKMRERILLAQLSGQEDAATRAARDQQLQEAAIALQLADTGEMGAELSPDVVKQLAGTPYAARIQQHQTLPSRSVAGLGPVDFSSPGGQPYAMLKPTQAQMREQGQRSALEAVTKDQTLPAPVRRLVDLRRVGVNIPDPESLETPAERDARARTERDSDFSDFTRRADYQARIQAGVRRQAAFEAANAPVTARDRREAMRLADNAAADYLDSLKDSLGMLPDGVDAAKVRSQFIDEYMTALEPATSPANTRRVITDLRQIVRPQRTGRMTSEAELRPVVAASGKPSASDPYERYLARTAR
jgi:hypothetical protein